MSKTMTLAVLAAISNAQFFTADGDSIEEIDCGSACVCDLRDRECWGGCFDCLEPYFRI